MARGLVNMGANLPQNAAVPISRDQVRALCRAVPVQLGVPIWLMWKTASRWDDVALLTRENFLILDPNEIIIRFTSTKANRAMVCTPSSFVQILDTRPMTPVVNYILNLPPGESIMPVTRAQFVQAIQAKFPWLTAHSFKKGASDHLVRMVEEGKLEKRILPLILKHQDKENAFPANTIRYSSEPERYARILGTGKATVLLSLSSHQ